MARTPSPRAPRTRTSSPAATRWSSLTPRKILEWSSIGMRADSTAPAASPYRAECAPIAVPAPADWDNLAGMRSGRTMMAIGLALGLWLNAPAGCGAVEATCGAGKSCVCEGAGSCEYDCPGGGCDMRCEGAGACDFRCDGGGCDVACDGQGACELACPGNNCNLSCTGAGSCELTECTKDCELSCTTVGSCESSCTDPSCKTN